MQDNNPNEGITQVNDNFNYNSRRNIMECVIVMVGIMLMIAWIADLIDKVNERKHLTMLNRQRSDPSTEQIDKTKERKQISSISRGYSGIVHIDSDNIQNYGINEIRSCGKFTPAERAAEYRRRGKSPSGVIDGVYNDAYRGNGAYNDSYRDWDANA
jgi:hypothetical protein